MTCSSRDVGRSHANRRESGEGVAILETLEFIDWLRAAFGGWRFVFSTSFRRGTAVRWEHERWLRKFWDIVCGVSGIAFTLFLVYVLISLFAGWVSVSFACWC